MEIERSEWSDTEKEGYGILSIFKDTVGFGTTKDSEPNGTNEDPLKGSNNQDM